MNVQIGNRVYTPEESTEIEFVKKEISELEERRKKLFNELLPKLNFEEFKNNEDFFTEEEGHPCSMEVIELFDYIFNDFFVTELTFDENIDNDRN
jgi:hypothetical protein